MGGGYPLHTELQSLSMENLRGIGPKFLVRAETRDKTHLIEGQTLPVPPNASICSKSLKVSIPIASPLESGDIPGELAKTCRPNDSPTGGQAGGSRAARARKESEKRPKT